MSVQKKVDDPPLIDCHAHIWEANMPVVSSAWKQLEGVYTAEQYISDLDEHGVSYGVIAAASLFGTYNDYSIRSLRKYKRLRATVNVDVDIDLFTLEAMKAEGIVGVRLQWFFKNPLPKIDSDDFQRMCCRLRDLDMHLHLNIEGDRLVEVSTLLLATGVKFVIDHFGWHDPKLGLNAPSYKGMLKLLEQNNAWVKLSSGFRHPDDNVSDWTLPIQYAQDLLQRFGAQKLLWGSDSPFIGHERVASYTMAIDRYKLCVPDSATRRAIDENGYKFYFEDK